MSITQTAQKFNNLTLKDLENHRRRFVFEDPLKSIARRVGDLEGAAIVGRTPRAGESYAGIVYGYFGLDGNKRGERLRVDDPPLEQRPDGSTKQKFKYLTAPGSKQSLFFVPGTTPEMLSNVDLPICLFEGEVKALSGSCVASYNATPPRYLSIGMCGAFGLFGKKGKELQSDGSKRDVTGPIPDLAMIQWNQRRVNVVTDLDYDTNYQVKAGYTKTIAALKERGADVRLVKLPKAEGEKGFDDLVGAWAKTHGDEEATKRALQLIESAVAIETKKSAADHILEIADALSYFHNSNGEEFAILIESEKTRRVLKVGSSDFRDYLSRLYYHETGKAVASQSLQDSINTIKAKAKFECPLDETHIRYAQKDGDIFIDLCNEGNNVVRVNSRGWEVIDSGAAPVYFRRSKGQGALPIPTRSDAKSEKDAQDAYFELLQFINVAREDYVLLAAYIIAAMRPTGPYPILAVYGSQGSAKSTCTKILRDLIDPNVAPLRSPPKDERSTMISAKNGWVQSYDNISTIGPDFSDILCRLSTGGGLSGRQLYSDDEEVIFSASRPVILNGITEIATRPDLLDRCVTISLPVLDKSNRRSAKEIDDGFSEARPRILGGLLDKLSEGLKNLDSVELEELPRMADFALLGFAAFGQAFLDRYSDSRENANEVALENSVIAGPLIKFLSKVTAQSSDYLWSGTSGELLEAVLNVADDREKNLKSFPKTAHHFSGQLKRIDTNLRESGFAFRRGFGSTEEKRKFYIDRIGQKSVSSVSSVSSANKSNTPAQVAKSDTKNRSDAYQDAQDTQDADIRNLSSSDFCACGAALYQDRGQWFCSNNCR